MSCVLHHTVVKSLKGAQNCRSRIMCTTCMKPVSPYVLYSDTAGMGLETRTNDLRWSLIQDT
mgnify:CR=1 FL=1